MTSSIMMPHQHNFFQVFQKSQTKKRDQWSCKRGTHTCTTDVAPHHWLFFSTKGTFHSSLGNHHCTNNFKVTNIGALLSKKLDIKIINMDIKSLVVGIKCTTSITTIRMRSSTGSSPLFKIDLVFLYEIVT